MKTGNLCTETLGQKVQNRRRKIHLTEFKFVQIRYNMNDRRLSSIDLIQIPFHHGQEGLNPLNNVRFTIAPLLVIELIKGIKSPPLIKQ